MADAAPDLEYALSLKRSKIALARQDYNEFAEYILKDQRTGKPIQQGMYHELWTEIRRRHKRAVIIGHVEAGKALPLTTPIATSTGWLLLRDLTEGMTVYDLFGDPCTVTALSPIEVNKPVFRIQFDDNTEIVADIDHRWLVHDGDDDELSVCTTGELVIGFEVNRWAIPCAGPVSYAERDLLVHPYMLGVWLGVGNKDGAVVTCPLTQTDMIRRACDLDGDIESLTVNEGAVKAQIVKSIGKDKLAQRLRLLGLLGRKAVPPAYCLGSIEQRQELLAGLCDAIAVVGFTGQRNVIQIPTTVDLAPQILELVRSLGYFCTLSVPQDGRFSNKHVVAFVAEQNIFRCRVKRNLFRPDFVPENPPARTITRIIEAGTSTVRCISVDSETHSYIAGQNYVVTHNTQQFSVGVPIHELGMDPRKRFAVVSKTHEQAVKIVRTQMGYIARSKEVRETFPHLVPGNLWSEKFGYTVERDGEIVEPSCQAVGFRKAVSGARLDGIILDDFLDSVNTNTKRKRDDADEWFHQELISRLTEDAWVYFLGNAWHNDDLYHRLERSGWPTFRFPVKVSKEMIAAFPEIRKPVSRGGWGRRVGDLSWPEVYTQARIEAKKKDLDARHPYECARQLFCVVRDDAMSSFRQSWIDSALKAGEFVPYCRSIHDFMAWDTEDMDEDDLVEYAKYLIAGAEFAQIPDYEVVTGVDLSTGKATDKTALASVALNLRTKKRFLLNLETGLWQVDEIIKRVKDVHSRYGGAFIVENNGGQDYIIQLLQGNTSIPVYPYTTGMGKANPLTGIEVLAAEFSNKKWVIPSQASQVQRMSVGLSPVQESMSDLIDEMLAYSSENRQHTGDSLIALWLAQLGLVRLEQAQQHGTSQVTII